MVPRLHLVTDLSVSLDTIDAAVEGGVDAVHLRDHRAAAGELLERGGLLKRMLGERAWLVVNDRVDVALALRAEAVQLGRRSLPIEAVRRLAPGLRVGASIHYAAEASLPADYLLLGTIYATASHPGEPGSGVALIAQVASETRTPIVAIGGIDGTNARACAAAGAQGVAVISAIAAAADPRAAAIALRRELET